MGPDTGLKVHWGWAGRVTFPEVVPGAATRAGGVCAAGKALRRTQQGAPRVHAPYPAPHAAMLAAEAEATQL